MDDELLKKSGYSDKAIYYYTNKVNVGNIKNPSVSFSYTGHCGDTMKVYLKIDANIIVDAKFEAIGCAGAFSAGSALMEMIKAEKLQEALKISEEDIIKHLGGIPETKSDCVCLARRTLEKTIQLFLDKK